MDDKGRGKREESELKDGEEEEKESQNVGEGWCPLTF